MLTQPDLPSAKLNVRWPVAAAAEHREPVFAVHPLVGDIEGSGIGFCPTRRAVQVVLVPIGEVLVALDNAANWPLASPFKAAISFSRSASSF
jgi:hypothetical protein